MSINHLNGSSLLPALSIAVSNTHTKVAASSDVILPSTPAITKAGNDFGSEDQIKQAIEKIQGTVNNLTRNLQFSIDKDTGQTVIKVMDTHTEEIIRQIPTEEAIEIARTLEKVQGILFNGQA
ncbi:MAG: flagellar biosynthesis protein FlaG [Nitrosomonas sp. PRO4]|nr:flagellar biosynthesis protein FlaG [Nitrosomonas sp. PRO4]